MYNLPLVFPQLRVGAYDDKVSHQVATTTVLISVTRNPNQPEFQNLPYQVTLQETTLVGTSVYRINATDRDGVSLHIEYVLSHFLS